MKKTRFMRGHIVGSLILIVLYELLLFGKDFSFFSDRGRDFIISNYVFTPLHYLAYLIISALPLIIVIYLSYSGKIKREYVLLSQIAASLFIPLIMCLPDYLANDNWGMFFNMIILVSNVILFTFNRIYYTRNS